MSRKSFTAPAPKNRRLPDEHVFHRNGIPTRNEGPEGCTDCPLPAKHPVHIDPPENPIGDVDARQLGERHEEGL